MTDDDVYAVLNFRLNDFLAVRPTEVEYRNVDFEPTLGTPYLKVDLIPAQTNQSSIGLNSCNRHTGIYQILVSLPKNRGLLDAKPIIDELKEYFKRSTAVVHSGVSVMISRFQLHQNIEDDAWFRYPVSISYRADLVN